MTAQKIKVMIPQLPHLSVMLPYLSRIDETRIYSNYGPLSHEFCSRLANLVGAPTVTLTSNGTTAIELALRARAIPGKHYCLMPAFTFIASAHAVCNAGLTPFLLDVSSEDMMLTPDIVEAVLPTLHESPAAVLVVSAFGAPPNLIVWANFEIKHKIPVIFDAAAAATALHKIEIQPVCISLHATKILGIGEGGAIFSSDIDLINRTTAMTGFGFLGSERISAIRGGNYRISEYTAAVGLAALDHLPSRFAALQSRTDMYRKRLANKQVRFQQGVGDKWIAATINVIVSPDAVPYVLKKLDADNIEWRRWWGLGCHLHPAFANLPRADLINTEALAPCVIGLPFHEQITEDEIDRIGKCLP